MIFKFLKLLILFFIFGFNNISYSEVVKKIKVIGNDRISDETIIMFSEVLVNDDIDSNKLNITLKNLYNTNFFDTVSVSLINNILEIYVKENPIIEKINFEGIKSKRILELIKSSLTLKSRSSYNELIFKKDKENIRSVLKELGYYFPSVETYVENLKNNKVNITYDFDLGEKAKIKKISFIGDKKFKDKKLKSIIVSEENKFWKFITSKKFINERIISLDKRLLKNFYLNKGYYDVVIDSSFAKLINNQEFELIYNIQANEKYYFNNLNITLF